MKQDVGTLPEGKQPQTFEQLIFPNEAIARSIYGFVL